MAMTDYTSKLVHTGYCDGNSARPINVYVAYKIAQSIDDNRSTIYCGMYVTTPSGWSIGKWADYNGSYVGTANNTFDGTIPNFSGTRWLAENLSFTVNHNDDGAATATIQWKWGVNSPWGRVQNPSGSFTITLPTIARASSISAGNGTLGVAQTLTVTRKSSSFTHTVTYGCGSVSGTILSKSAETSVSWTPPLSLAQQNTTGGSVSIKLTITTFNGSTQVGASKSITISASIPASVAPSASIALSDPTGYKDTYGGYVQGRSQLAIALTGTGAQGSTIKSYQINVDGSVYTVANKTVDLPANGVVPVTGTVVDSRARSASKSASITVLPYSMPTVLSLSAVRCAQDGAAQDDGAYAKITFSASITPIDGLNSAAYKIQYKKSGAANWTEVSVAASAGDYDPADVSVIIAADPDYAYTVRLAASDAFQTVYAERTVPIAFILLQGDGTGTGLAIGQRATKPKVFSVGIPAEFNSDMECCGLFQPRKGQYAWEANAGGGSNGYLKIARIKLSGTYNNQPLEIALARRADSKVSRLSVRFVNSGSDDPALSLFTVEGPAEAALARADTNTWDLYVRKTESYDAIAVVGLYAGAYARARTSVEWASEFVSSLPSGATQAVAISYAAANHNHDSAYAAAGHNHDSAYAPKSHTHAPSTKRLLSRTDLSSSGSVKFTSSDSFAGFVVYSYIEDSYFPAVVTPGMLGQPMAIGKGGTHYSFTLSKSGNTYTLKRGGSASVSYVVDGFK